MTVEEQIEELSGVALWRCRVMRDFCAIYGTPEMKREVELHMEWSKLKLRSNLRKLLGR